MKQTTTTTTRHCEKPQATRQSRAMTGWIASGKALAMTMMAGVLLFASGCAKDHGAEADGQKCAVRFTASADGFAPATRAGNLTLAEGGKVTVSYTPAQGEAQTAEYTLSADGALTPATAADVIYIKQGTAQAGITAWGTLLYDGDVPAPVYFAAADAVVTWSGSTASISLSFAPASSRVVVRVLGGYGETEPLTEGFTAAISPKVPTVEGGLYTWDATPALVAGTAGATVEADNESECEIVPATVAADTRMLSLAADADAGALYEGNVWYVLSPAGGFTFAAAKRYLLTVQLSDGGEATLSIVEIEPFDDGGTILSDDGLIRTPEDMEAFIEDLAMVLAVGGNAAFEAKWVRMGAVRLGADIDMTAVSEEMRDAASAMPLGSPTLKLVFDGNGYALDGLTAPLFAVIEAGSEVRNLRLTGVNIDNTADYTGALAGYNLGTVRGVKVSGTVSGKAFTGGVIGSNGHLVSAVEMTVGGTVSGCEFSGTVSGTNYTGGIAGWNNGATIKGCHTTGADTKVINTGGVNTGGIVGENYYGGTIGGTGADACTVSGTVSGTRNYVGGIVGLNRDSVIGCKTEAGTTVSGSGSFTGGIAGNNYGGTVTDCKTEADTTVSGSYVTGGIVGQNGGPVTGCAFSGTVSGTNDFTGGIAGSNHIGSVTGCTTADGATITSEGYSVGGITGSNMDGIVAACWVGADVTVEATGKDLNGYSQVGGIAGSNSGTVAGSWSAASSVKGAETATVGGAVGCNGNYNTVGTVSGCGWLTGANIPAAGVNANPGWPDLSVTDGLFSFGSAAAVHTTVYAALMNASVAVAVASGKDPAAAARYWTLTGGRLTPTPYDPGYGATIKAETERLIAWAEACVAGTRSNFTLRADVDLSGYDWTPVGTSAAPFRNRFNGGGHTIRGLSVNFTTGSFAGLFGVVGAGGEVSNVTVSGTVRGASGVGGIAGRGTSGALITACTFSGTVAGDRYIGGIVGESVSATITGCTATGKVGGTSEKVGGIVGSNGGTIGGAEAGAVCTFSGTVTGKEFVGGIVGDNGGSVTGCRLGDGSTVGGTSGVGGTGGIVGSNSGPVTGCEVGANVSISGKDFVGGIAGGNSNPVSNCRVGANADIRGAAGIGGIAGGNQGGEVTNCRVEAGAVVHGTGNRVGGIIGSKLRGRVSLCYSLAASVTGGGEVGGIVGLNTDMGRVSQCYWLKEADDAGANQPDNVAGVDESDPPAITDCASAATAGNPENPGGSPIGSVVNLWWAAGGRP